MYRKLDEIQDRIRLSNKKLKELYDIINADPMPKKQVNDGIANKIKSIKLSSNSSRIELPDDF